MCIRDRFACATDESKPILTGALFEAKEESISVVALDGYRLAIYRDVPQNHRLPVDFVVPARYLSEIARTLGDGKEDISLYLGQNQMMVDLGNTRITTRLLAVSYTHLDVYKRQGATCAAAPGPSVIHLLQNTA